jgi:protease YdgD
VKWTTVAMMLRLLLSLLLFMPAAALAQVPAGVIGADDRVPVDSQDWPWAAIGRVNRATGGYCTGTLIGPRQVLTVAHCLYDARRGRFALPADVHFVAGYRRGSWLAHSIASAVIVADGYVPRERESLEALSHDWAVIVLANDVGIRPIPWRPLDAGDLLDAGSQGTITRAGYSRDRAHMLSAHRGCAVTGVIEGGVLVIHECDGTNGDSGSPLLLEGPDGPELVGLHLASGEGSRGVTGVAVAAEAFAPLLEQVAATSN